MKRIFAIVLSMIIIFGIAGCGGGEDPDAGRYEGYQVEILGWMSMDKVFTEGENYIELKQGGKGVFCLSGDSIDIKWILDGENLRITADGSECNATLKEGVITTDLFGEATMMTFVKEGAAKPKSKESSGEQNDNKP